MKLLKLLFLTIIILLQSVYADIPYLTLKQLTENSDYIITGKVIDVYSKVELRNNRQIVYTFVTVSCNGCLKGNKTADNITIKMIGGKTPEFIYMPEDFIRFEKNESVILFLKKGDNNVWKIPSLSGKISIIEQAGIKTADCSYLRGLDISDQKMQKYLTVCEIQSKILKYSGK